MALNQMDHPFENVYTVVDYYDGPRSGVADYSGAPHSYRALFSEAADDWDAELFELSPLSQEALALVLEEWAIWKRFELQYRTGQATWSGADDEWGTLQKDRQRHRELRSVLETALKINPHRRLVARAEFRALDQQPPHILGVLRRLEVRWIPVK